MQIRASRPLSVIGAMKDIQQYKIMKGQADMAPTLVEKAKLELDWKTKDRPLSRKKLEQDIEKGEQDIVTKERESLWNYYNDTSNMSEWILEGESEEERKRRFDVSKRLITKAHEDHVTSAGPGGKPGDLIGEYDEEQLRTMASMGRKKAEAIKLGARDRIVEKGPGGEYVEKVSALPTAEKDPTTAMAKFIKDNPNATTADLIAFSQSLKAKGIKMTSPDGTVIEIGGPQGSDLSGPTVTGLQKSLVGLSKQLSDLGAIDVAKFTEALTIPGKIKKFALRTADKWGADLSKESKEYIGKTRVFIESIEQVFNQYRKEITGAQAAMKEIEMLRASILNKEMTPTEFEYSFKSYVSKVKRMMRLTRGLMRDGFTNEGGALGRELQSRYDAAGDVPDIETDARGEEIAASLRDQYDDTEEGQQKLGQAVYKQLISEGYNLGE